MESWFLVPRIERTLIKKSTNKLYTNHNIARNNYKPVVITLAKDGKRNIRSTKRGELMSKDNLLEILQNNGDLNDVKPNSITTLKEELVRDLDHVPFVESDIGKKILNCKHCENCKPMETKYQKYNFLEDDSVTFCDGRKCCVHLDDVCAMLTINVCKYRGI